MLKKILSKPVDWAVYSLLGEEQRKQIGDLLTQKQKDTVVRLLNGKKFTQRRKLKVLKQHLYNLGFTDRALLDMNNFLREVDNMEIKRLISWELSLWHANKNTTEGARAALDYLPTAATGETSVDQQRRISIVKAECLARVGHLSEAKAVLQQQLATQVHPDLYLALANLETDISKRFEAVNQVFDMYHLAQIGFSKEHNQTYDDLTTQSRLDPIIDGPKVSIILPAFKAEKGIKVAIDSILGQTWTNLELIVVDDCSPDGTVDIVKTYVEKDERLKLMSTPVNSGPYIARNIGLKAASGVFVTINDADDWSHKEKIKTQVIHLIDNPRVIANTSEHARLTEDLTFYRRGTPGKYIFPNMSSIMFRREPVLETIGYWDSVRFAADGEFKRRLIRAFGQNSYVDLKSGPLSLPRQSVSSLTSSSAFGYDGFFMGVRKEYVESLEFHHRKADTLYYDYPQSVRPFPVPEPMWPEREEKPEGIRQFDYVIVGDFRQESEMHMAQILDLKAQHHRIGLVQLYSYDLQVDSGINPTIREMIDGTHVQMLVYGEHIHTATLNVMDPELLTTWQKYRPTISAENVTVTANKMIKSEHLTLIQTHMMEYFNTKGTWVTKDSEVQSYLERFDIIVEKKIAGGASDV